jgi:hypothetical protein
MNARPLIIALFLVSGANAEEPDDHRDWHFMGSLVYSTRSLDGLIVNRNALNSGVYGDLVTTGDAMGVDDSRSAMLFLAAQYRQFGFGINYMPTSYSGSGYALVAGTGPNAGLFIQTPLKTRIDVNMLLASVYYDFIQTPDTAFGVGAGFGQTWIDLSIVPETGTALAYDGSQPFGFLNVHFRNYHNRFLYGFSLNGLSMDVDGVHVAYSDYRLDLGYRLTEGTVKLDLVGGYRQVNFAMDLDWSGGAVMTDVSMEGPFLGIVAIY